MGLKCLGSLIPRFFSVVDTRVLHDLWLVESKDAEEPWKAGYKLYSNFQLCRGLTPLTPMLFKGQLYI